jgi:hypothetical protein
MTTPTQAQEREFDIWWQQEKLRTWRQAGCHIDRGETPSVNWGEGKRPDVWRGWLARATHSPAPASGEAVWTDAMTEKARQLASELLPAEELPRANPAAGAESTAASDAASWAEEWGTVKRYIADSGAQRTDYVFTADRFGHMLDAFERHCKAIYSQPASSERDAEDAARLDWLESKTVNVRQRLRYGSTSIFWAGPEEGDGEILPSDLRQKIDAQREQSEKRNKEHGA